MSYNKWLFVYANPVTNFDPTGMFTCTSQSPCPMWNLVKFEYDASNAPMGAGGKPKAPAIWTEAEKQTVRSAASLVAYALKRAIIQQEVTASRADKKDCDLNGEVYQRPNVNAAEAFLRVYGGPVTFVRVAYGCPEACFGRTLGAQKIRVYDGARVANNPKFPMHELGHAFEVATKDIVKPAPRDVLQAAQAADPAFPDRQYDTQAHNKDGSLAFDANNNPIMIVDPQYLGGFAGPRFGWQQSAEDTPGEEFADMYIG
jgi:hypothetical protein